MEDNEPQVTATVPLTSQALRLFIEKTQRENAETRSWVRQPNNLISVVAIVLSLWGFFHQIRKEQEDGINQDLASLSKIASDLTELSYQSATATNITDDYRIFANNRRAVLLAEADRLIKELGNRVPVAQLGALGPEYAQIGDRSPAIKYFQLQVQTSSSPTEQLDALRSIATLYAEQGPDHYEDARKTFAQAANIFPDPSDMYAIGLELQVHEQWATFETATQNYEVGFQHLEIARSLANRFPCVPVRSAVVARLDAESQGSLEQTRNSDPAHAASDQLAWNQIIGADKCPKTTPASPSPALPVPAAPVLPAQANSPRLTTVCHFTAGQRAGTDFDFKPYGVQAVPVGYPCNDGHGSFGTAQ